MISKNAFAIILSAGVACTASADVITGSNGAILEWGISPTNGSAVTAGAVTLFPSDIVIANGATNIITDVNVTLKAGAHTWADDMEISLRSPSGTIIELMRDAGGNDNIAGVLTFDDDAAGMIGDTGQGANDDLDFSGTFMTSLYGTSVGSTAPAANAVGLAAFNGEDANGTWSLFVFDDAGADTGAFTDGWNIELTVIPAPASAVLLGLGGIAAIRRRR